MAMKSLIFAFIALSISIKSIEAVNVESALNLINQDLTKATETLNHAAELLKKTVERGDWERYGTCVEEYHASVSRNLPNAAKSLKSGSYNVAVDELKATLQHADNCESQFGGSSPFSGETKAVKDLTFEAIGVIQKGLMR